jgi:hypothetical protein
MKEKNEKINLTEKDFEFLCPVKTSDMKVIDGVYFCDKCEKKVHDVSNYTQDELDVLKTNNSGLCINFKKIVTTTLILNATLCVAVGTTEKSKLAPLSKFTSNQTVFFEHEEPVVMGGMPIPITIFEVDGDIWVPIEPIVVPPAKGDDNSTKGGNCKGVM